MGREELRLQVEVVCSLSRHNSPQDVEDDAQYQELAQRIADAVADIVTGYEPIISYVDLGPGAIDRTDLWCEEEEQATGYGMHCNRRRGHLPPHTWTTTWE